MTDDCSSDSASCTPDELCDFWGQCDAQNGTSSESTGSATASITTAPARVTAPTSSAGAAPVDNSAGTISGVTIACFNFVEYC